MGKERTKLLQLLELVTLVTAILVAFPLGVNSSIALNCSVINYYKKGFSLERPFVGSASGRLEGTNWEYSGHTEVLGDKGIRLLHSGSLWNFMPVDMENWQVEIQFRVHLDEAGDTGERHDGTLDDPLLLFWYTHEMKAHREPDEFFQGLRLEMESPLPHTQANPKRAHQHPGIGVLINGSPERFTGRTRESRGSTRACWNPQGNAQIGQMWLRIRYEGDQMTVTLKRKVSGYELVEKWQECFHETWRNLKLPAQHQDNYFGISSSVPESIGSVAILSVRIYELDLQHSMTPACKNTHIHAYAYDDEDDLHGTLESMHRPVVLAKQARRDDLNPPGFAIPLLVIGVLTVALIVIGVLSAAWWAERSRQMRREKLPTYNENTPGTSSTERPLVPRSPYKEFY